MVVTAECGSPATQKSESFLWSAVRLQAWMSSSNTGFAEVLENLP
jgi:hypothetical protein